MSEKTVSPEEVRHMATLSRLSVESEEEALFCRQFGQIIAHMDILASVDTQNVEPLYTPGNESAALRDDIADNRRSRQEMLANAPETDGECFIVPRIV